MFLPLWPSPFPMAPARRKPLLRDFPQFTGHRLNIQRFSVSESSRDSPNLQYFSKCFCQAYVGVFRTSEAIFSDQ